MNIKNELIKSIASFQKEIIVLKNTNQENEKSCEKKLDDIFCEFISVIDAFERSELAIKEYELDDNAKKAIKRLLNAKKKAQIVLNKFNVQEIVFENNRSIDQFCVVNDTEPDSSRETGEIISIEKKGYTRKGCVIRPAEVVIVKN
ncbi:MAG: nucleotide exchange factor GrpE [Tannerellaceae bacterium]